MGTIFLIAQASEPHTYESHRDSDIDIRGCSSILYVGLTRNCLID